MPSSVGWHRGQKCLPVHLHRLRKLCAMFWMLETAVPKSASRKEDRLRMKPGNLFANIPTPLPKELVEVLQENPNIRIERIVSLGHTSPEGFWYAQPNDEWVLLVQGAARMRCDEEDQPVELKPGDYLNIPAHRRHRIEWTDPSLPTIWLAVHYGD
jgi:cupin 2 domain-containing protein